MSTVGAPSRAARSSPIRKRVAVGRHHACLTARGADAPDHPRSGALEAGRLAATRRDRGDTQPVQKVVEQALVHAWDPSQCSMEFPYGWRYFRAAMSTEGHDAGTPQRRALRDATWHHLGVTSVIELRGELDLAGACDARRRAGERGPESRPRHDRGRRPRRTVTSADASTVSWLLHADAVVRLSGGRSSSPSPRQRAGGRRSAADRGRAPARRGRRRSPALIGEVGAGQSG